MQHVRIFVQGDVDDDVVSFFVTLNRVQEEERLGGADDFGGFADRIIHCKQ